MKKIFAFVLILIFLASLTLAGNVYPDKKDTVAEKGVWRVTHYDARIGYPRINEFIKLTSPTLDPFKGMGRGGYPNDFRAGTAYIRSTGADAYPKTSVKVKTSNLPSSYEQRVFFEGWLVDTDTGFHQSVGVFYTAMGGVGELRTTFNNYAGAFEKVVVTIEPFYDIDPGPGEVILEGYITPYQYLSVQPKPTKMITDVIKNYS